MRRADRLFQIIQILRRSTRPVTADMLAEELEVSKRSRLPRHRRSDRAKGADPRRGGARLCPRPRVSTCRR